jgi:hypothetical protein
LQEKRGRGLIKCLELVVAESVLVLTRLLQVPNEERSKSVIALVKLLDTLKVPMARANILWLVGQYAETLPKVGPDVLRQAVKNFVNEVRHISVCVAESKDISFSNVEIMLGQYYQTSNFNFICKIDLFKYGSSYFKQFKSIFTQLGKI